MAKARIGIIGCGNISNIYLTNLCRSEDVEVAACADADLERAKERAAQHGVSKACSVEELLADPSIDIVVNLTIPQAHAEISLRALEAGKHVYGEKPLAVTMEEGVHVLAAAAARGLRVACAPETFLGGGIQTCRKIIDEGAIGQPVAASGFMMSRGHENWHPDPAFYYQVGGGPMFDMGPYYLTALVTLLGPIRRVTGSAVITHPERTITSQPKHGQKIAVETPTHIAGVLDFASGAVATLVTSFDIAADTKLPNIEIYGTAGSLRVPDPNGFGGEVQLRKAGSSEWTSIPLTHGFTDNNRGIGVIDMAKAIAEDRPHRAEGKMAYHVLEAMHGFHIASSEGQHYTMKSECNRPEPMPTLD
ncbi:oxidoreductase domain protein [Paenibacillus curdlanolyticus YK9]|uniref:Oxidoreductase domain protein n=1 Tax=Paenibacillus curdlanolyticus YK9 TaxID=717606 RepID=E0I6X1_9BACL|nr:Gfo/Idh/MocA family oxidoreductase [Paenibacillus curdlanolyticus]EFM11787.1 oxidoreductase domain protein [Paenibacillus curdlanolyticus YK9]